MQERTEKQQQGLLVVRVSCLPQLLPHLMLLLVLHHLMKQKRKQRKLPHLLAARVLLPACVFAVLFVLY
jgi:hypothetical protein